MNTVHSLRVVAYVVDVGAESKLYLYRFFFDSYDVRYEAIISSVV